MKLGIFGGTFNPIHNGHLRLLESCIKAFALDETLLVPAAVPPHKSDRELISGEHRVNMCRLAIKDLAGVRVSELELERGGKSYTVDTLLALKSGHADDELYLIMGSDMFFFLEQWRDFPLMAKLAVMCTAPREQDELQRLCAHRDHLKEMGVRALVVEETPLVTSSSEIRAGQKEDTLPGQVREYILQNGLYGHHVEDYHYDLDEITQYLRTRLGRERFTHSLNVASEALRLARHYGEMQEAAYVAGLVHDACKELPQEKMLQIIKNADIISETSFLHYPKVTHGFAASFLIQEELNIRNTAIIEAVRYHTTGRANMTRMDKIVYLADLISADRSFPGVEELRAAAYQSLDKAMADALLYSVRSLSAKGMPIYEDTFKAYNEYVV